MSPFVFICFSFYIFLTYIFLNTHIRFILYMRESKRSPQPYPLFALRFNSYGSNTMRKRVNGIVYSFKSKKKKFLYKRDDGTLKKTEQTQSPGSIHSICDE